MVEAPEAPCTRGGVLGQKTLKNLPPLKDHLCAKFRLDLSSRLDFYRKHTDSPTLPFMYYLDGHWLTLFWLG